MLPFSGLFCIVGGHGETNFPVSAAQFAAKVSVGKYGSTIHGASDRSIRKESVVSAWISNPTGGNKEIRTCSKPDPRANGHAKGSRMFTVAGEFDL